MENETEVNNTSEFTDIVKPKFGKGKLILLIVLGILIIGGGCFLGLYYKDLNNPVKVFHSLIETGVDEYFDMANIVPDSDKLKLNMGMDFDIQLSDPQKEDEKFLDLINKTNLKMNVELDSTKNKYVATIDANYDNEKLLNLQGFIEKGKENIYLFLPDFYDKYVEVKLEGEDASGLTNTSFSKLLDKNKAKDILSKELKSIVKENECQKEDEIYVFTITADEFVKRIKEVTNNLENNQEFLNSYSDNDGIKDLLDNLKNSLDNVEVTSDVIKFNVKKKGLSNKPEEISIKSSSDEMVFTFNENVDYKYIIDGEEVTGTIKTEEQNNGEKIEFSANVKDFGKITFTIDYKVEKLDKISEVDTSKVVKSDDITEAELMEIMNKLQSSKLFTLISEFIGSGSPQDVTVNSETIIGV